MNLSFTWNGIRVVYTPTEDGGRVKPVSLADLDTYRHFRDHVIGGEAYDKVAFNVDDGDLEWVLERYEDELLAAAERKLEEMNGG